MHASINKQQAEKWVDDLINELGKINTNNSNAEILDFLSKQYIQIHLLHRAIKGEVRFVGAPPVGEV